MYHKSKYTSTEIYTSIAVNIDLFFKERTALHIISAIQTGNITFQSPFLWIDKLLGIFHLEETHGCECFSGSTQNSRST
jgi:hypothetical protein